jgi:hypothetical protein
MTEEPRPSRAHRLSGAIGVTVVLVGMIVFVIWFWSRPTPDPVCDHVAAIAKQDPHEAQAFVDALGAKTCREGMAKIEGSLEDEKLTKVIDCLMAASTAVAARACLSPTHTGVQ